MRQLDEQKKEETGVESMTAADLRDAVSVAADRYHAEYPTADRDAIETHMQIVYAGGDLRQAVARFFAAEGFGVSGQRFTILRLLYLAKNQEMSQGGIARELGVTSANITQVVDVLEREGLVERVVNATDRRVTCARLTPAGRSHCDVMMPAMVKFMEETSAALTRAEKVQLIRLLAKVRRDVRTRLLDS